MEEVTKVTVYSNLPEVERFAKGNSLGKITAEDHFLLSMRNVTFTKEELLKINKKLNRIRKPKEK